METRYCTTAGDSSADGIVVPDLAFSEMRFLEKKQNSEELPDAGVAEKKPRRRDKPKVTDEEFSAYFNTTDRHPLVERSGNTSTPKRKVIHKSDKASKTGRQRRVKLTRTVLPTNEIAPIAEEASPHPDSKELNQPSASYLTWSQTNHTPNGRLPKTRFQSFPSTANLANSRPRPRPSSGIEEQHLRRTTSLSETTEYLEAKLREQAAKHLRPLSSELSTFVNGQATSPETTEYEFHDHSDDQCPKKLLVSGTIFHDPRQCSKNYSQGRCEQENPGSLTSLQEPVPQTIRNKTANPLAKIAPSNQYVQHGDAEWEVRRSSGVDDVLYSRQHLIRSSRGESHQAGLPAVYRENSDGYHSVDRTDCSRDERTQIMKRRFGWFGGKPTSYMGQPLESIADETATVLEREYDHLPNKLVGGAGLTPNTNTDREAYDETVDLENPIVVSEYIEVSSQKKEEICQPEEQDEMFSRFWQPNVLY